ncbi:OmpP1/FadL family transporter [Hyalangium rubrum]|uniref:Outer membrane protein transport protein n=1 Tax=Hyalangium rubrum TaxID=3103134 RepID=A0ABU5HB60_9BACT|nr:outer membrane protein transport protein [Hyalangium sp. s54d21]MDY7230068.1 outer membrane protein transport protein [Hyalangium sp. s54d21]
MMKNTLSVVTLLAAGVSHAAGFSVDTHSARATGMASTANALMDDSSAVAYNAANILGVEKLDVTVGDVAIIPRLTFTPTDGQKQGFKPTVVPPPHAFAVYRINEKMAAGIGLYVPFGAGSNWVDDFVGRTIGYESQVATYFINPTFAYQPIDGLRLGVGVSLVRGTVSIRRKLDFVASEGAIELGGGGWGFGYNVGAQYEAVDNFLSIGASFRGPSKVNFDGKGDFQDVPDAFAAQLQDQPVKAAITLPGTARVGLALTPLERLKVGLDANLVLWSSIDRFGVEFENPALTSFAPKQWKNTWNFHVGAEYGVTEALAVRVGLAYDPSPSPAETLTPDLPDANRYNAAVGVGYSFSPVRVDVGYQFAYLDDTASTSPAMPGTYGGIGHAVGLTLGYSMK